MSALTAYPGHTLLDRIGAREYGRAHGYWKVSMRSLRSWCTNIPSLKSWQRLSAGALIFAFRCPGAASGTRLRPIR